ncbi:hypothetical protein D3OALGB2SA_4787 [Olavius algarvensis associated proteobacterium Delta 3]|nr:hypothetical protein D3OALGB2SA_4787 [Olavius algarvensis associated proteobacterium Delta 3]
MKNDTFDISVHCPKSYSLYYLDAAGSAEASFQRYSCGNPKH